jgi:hypothetical protein
MRPAGTVGSTTPGSAFLASRLHRLDWITQKPLTAGTRQPAAKLATMAATADDQPCSRNAGRAALNGAGHAAARAEAARLARRGAQRRTAAAAAESAAIDIAIRRARAGHRG